MLEIAPRVTGDDPVRRADVTRLRAGHGLDGLRSAIHVMHDPLFAVFLLRATQLQMAIGVVFQLMAAPDQLLSRVKAGNADIFFMLRFAPGLGSKPPADHKK